MAVEMAPVDDTARRALFAHAFATLGETSSWECDQHRDRLWLLNQSLRYYAAALEGIQAKLKKPSQRKDDGLVAASRALASYEVSCHRRQGMAIRIHGAHLEMDTDKKTTTTTIDAIRSCPR